MRKGGLGKGLGALIPNESDGPSTDDGTLITVPVNDIVENPHQPRVMFDEETLVALAASIQELGVIQPVLVRALDDGRFQLIAGERRWRAAKRAGLDTIPAIVRSSTESAALEQALVENLHRADLNALEEATAYQQLLEEFGFTHEILARRVGKSRSAVTNTLRLLQLPAAIQHMVRDGRISTGHARALAGSPDRAFQERLARRVVEEGLSVRAVEDAIRARVDAAGEAPLVPPSSGRPPVTRSRPPGLLELEDLLSGQLDTRVRVEMGAKRGRVVIDFATLEDLERIYRRVTEGTRTQPEV